MPLSQRRAAAAAVLTAAAGASAGAAVPWVLGGGGGPVATALALATLTAGAAGAAVLAAGRRHDLGGAVPVVPDADRVAGTAQDLAGLARALDRVEAELTADPPEPPEAAGSAAGPPGPPGPAPSLAAALTREGDPGATADLVDLAERLDALVGAVADRAGRAAGTGGSVAGSVVNIARRTLVLLGRQLAVVDSLERGELDPDTLDVLYRLDHLATRMRRYAESLLVLVGEDTGRQARGPMPLSDVVRTATCGIEQYARIDVDAGAEPGTDDPLVVAHRALPAAHLLAELLENATAASDPSTRVRVSIGRTPQGARVTVADEGIGMTDAEIEAALAVVGTPGGEAATGSARLGLHVVGRLARRLGAGVLITRGEPAGLVVSVDLPADVLVRTGQAPAAPEPAVTAPVRQAPAAPGPAVTASGTQAPAPSGPRQHPGPELPARAPLPRRRDVHRTTPDAEAALPWVTATGGPADILPAGRDRRGRWWAPEQAAGRAASLRPRSPGAATSWPPTTPAPSVTALAPRPGPATAPVPPAAPVPPTAPDPVPVPGSPVTPGPGAPGGEGTGAVPFERARPPRPLPAPAGPDADAAPDAGPGTAAAPDPEPGGDFRRRSALASEALSELSMLSAYRPEATPGAAAPLRHRTPSDVPPPVPPPTLSRTTRDPAAVGGLLSGFAAGVRRGRAGAHGNGVTGPDAAEGANHPAAGSAAAVAGRSPDHTGTTAQPAPGLPGWRVRPTTEERP